MFADIVGFTSMCKRVSPGKVMAFLNTLYSAFDELLGIFGVYKVRRHLWGLQGTSASLGSTRCVGIFGSTTEVLPLAVAHVHPLFPAAFYGSNSRAGSAFRHASNSHAAPCQLHFEHVS